MATTTRNHRQLLIQLGYKPVLNRLTFQYLKAGCIGVRYIALSARNCSWCRHCSRVKKWSVAG